MGETIPVAVPRKGRPLQAVFDLLARRLGASDLADDVTSTLRREKEITKGAIEPGDDDVYRRLATYSDVEDPTAPEYTLLRDDRDGNPRRIVFDSVTVPIDDVADVPDGTAIQLIGRDEPFRALRTHELALGFDSADLVLEEVVAVRPDPLDRIADVNARIDPADTDVRVAAGLGDTVYHTLLSTPEAVRGSGPIDRSALEGYAGPLCIVPRYERLVRAVLGTRALEGIEFRYPSGDVEEEAAIAETGVGVYLTETGSTAREHGLVLGEELFPSETVLMGNVAERTPAVRAVHSLLTGVRTETELAV